MSHHGRSALSLIEILVAISVVAILLGLLLPAVGLVRQQARASDARQTVSELVSVFELYRRETMQRHLPPVHADGGIHRELLDELDERDLWSRGPRQLDAAGRLLDPWRRPYRYQLERPTPSAGAERLADWNWNHDHDREARWGKQLGGVGVQVEGALPYPYLWSLGADGDPDDASDWIFTEDGS